MRSSEMRASILPIVEGSEAPVRLNPFRLTPVILATLLTVEQLSPVQPFAPQGEFWNTPFVIGGHHVDRATLAAELTKAL